MSDITSHGSRKEPIRVPVRQDYHAWEYAEIKKAIGQATRLEQALIHQENRMIDRLLMETRKGEKHEFYFDVTDNIMKMSDQMAAAPIPARRTGVTIGRNKPCPCGSGQKFKKCCGKG